MPVLIYPDVREAVAWLRAAFGFVERVRIGESHRSQMRVGDGGAVIIGDVRRDRRPPQPGRVTHSVTVRVADVHAHCEHARQHGAQILMGPSTSSTASGSTRPPPSPAINGRSRRPWRTSTHGTGAASCWADAVEPAAVGPDAPSGRGRTRRPR